MAGILDLLGNPQAMGLLNLGAGLLESSGPSPMPVSTGQALGRGMQRGLQGALQAQQFGVTNELKNLELAKAKRQREIENMVLGRLGILADPQGTSVPALASVPESGLSPASATAIGAPWAAAPAPALLTGPQSAPSAAPQSMLPPGVDRTAALLAVAGGSNPGLLKLAEFAQSANKPTDKMRELIARGVQPGSPQWNAELSTSFNQGGAWQIGTDGQIRLASGYASGMGDVKRAEAGANAAYDLVDVPVPGGGTRQMTRADAVRLLGGGQQQAPVTAGSVPPSVVPNLPAGNLGYKQAPEQQAGSTRFAETLSGDMAKTYGELQRADFNAPVTIGKYSRLGNLLGQVNVGKYTGTTTDLKAAAKSLGFDLSAMGIPDDVAPAQAARALSAQIALELRNPAGGAGMPGALSDQDRKFLESMVPSLENDPGAIGKMIEYRVKLAEREQQVAKMARAYKKRTGRFDDAFYEELASWSASHPLFNAQDRAKVPNGRFRVIGIERSGQ